MRLLLLGRTVRLDAECQSPPGAVMPETLASKRGTLAAACLATAMLMLDVAHPPAQPGVRRSAANRTARGRGHRDHGCGPRVAIDPHHEPSGGSGERGRTRGARMKHHTNPEPQLQEKQMTRD